MGNKFSAHGDKQVFAKELSTLHNVVNEILSEKGDMFRNENYNFLSQEVCNNYTLLATSELNNHLKVNLQSLGETMMLVRNNNNTSKVSKGELCSAISNHYIKILYIMTLIKYVYNVENAGDFSIAGIVFRNIRFLENDVMELRFCNSPHKDYRKGLKEIYKIDFDKLVGLRFLVEYVLNPEESKLFLQVLKALFAKKKSSVIQDALCTYMKGMTTDGAKEHEAMAKEYFGEFKSKVVCNAKKVSKKTQKGGSASAKIPSLLVEVAAENPVLSTDYCYDVQKLVISLKGKEGDRIKEHYVKMKDHYVNNIKRMEAILAKMVKKEKKALAPHGYYELVDIDTAQLEKIIQEVKEVVQQLYLQSIMDYQLLLDVCKKSKNILL